VRRYTDDEELREELRHQVKDWGESGLIAAGQAAALAADLTSPLRRTGFTLRLGLAGFTVIAAAATVALAFVTLDIRDGEIIGALAVLFGLAAFAAADALVARFRLYRHGVEEALAALSVALCGVGAAVLTSALAGSAHDTAIRMIGFGTCALVSALAYRRFGFRYAAVVSLAFAAWIPFGMRNLGLPARHIITAGVCATVFAVARRYERAATSHVRREDAAVLAAAAFAGAYLVLNLFVSVDRLIGANLGVLVPYAYEIAPWFKWTTYALTWILPAAGIWRGITERNRMLIDAGLAAGLVTLVTNKSYLGWPRQTWDPMLLGIALVLVAVGVRRWLAHGPGGERHGFTSARVLRSEADAIRFVSVASAAVHPVPEPTPPAGPPQFGGGRSGGGGGGGEF